MKHATNFCVRDNGGLFVFGCVHASTRSATHKQLLSVRSAGIHLFTLYGSKAKLIY
eukprot:m.260507 g.260507  ORF g.260507 m.260507 type:complete len:56 (+) comp15562_c0_seq4:116-283(+)